MSKHNRPRRAVSPITARNRTGALQSRCSLRRRYRLIRPSSDKIRPNPARQQGAARLEHWTGGARDQMVVQALMSRNRSSGGACLPSFFRNWARWARIASASRRRNSLFLLGQRPSRTRTRSFFSAKAALGSCVSAVVVASPAAKPFVICLRSKSMFVLPGSFFVPRRPARAIGTVC
jgi:hypothetical protein